MQQKTKVEHCIEVYSQLICLNCGYIYVDYILTRALSSQTLHCFIIVITYVKQNVQWQIRSAEFVRFSVIF